MLAVLFAEETTSWTGSFISAIGLFHHMSQLLEMRPKRTAFVNISASISFFSNHEIPIATGHMNETHSANCKSFLAFVL